MIFVRISIFWQVLFVFKLLISSVTSFRLVSLTLELSSKPLSLYIFLFSLYKTLRLFPNWLRVSSSGPLLFLRIEFEILGILSSLNAFEKRHRRNSPSVETDSFASVKFTFSFLENLFENSETKVFQNNSDYTMQVWLKPNEVNIRPISLLQRQMDVLHCPGCLGLLKTNISCHSHVSLNNIFERSNSNYLRLKETRNSHFCVTPQNQALHKSASLFLK